MTCSCCGEDRDPATLATLSAPQQVSICRNCIGWLARRAGSADSTPILPVRDLDEAVTFYERAGFDARRYDGGGFAFVTYHDVSVFDLDWSEQLDVAANRSGCYLIVAKVDEWHAELAGKGFALSELSDQPWGMREFTLTDPSGNYVRIGRNT